MSQKSPKILIKIAIVSCLVLIFAALNVSIWGYFYASSVFSNFSGVKPAVASLDQTSFIYSDNGTLIKELHGEVNRIPVSIDEVPRHVQHAFVAIEDERFYRHHGIDLKAIVRALYSYIKEGRITEGASTITQQTMKMYFLTPEQTLVRKIKEAILALEFERRYSKDEVLELYLNRAYFGEGAYGLQTAARVYFSKDVSQLTVSEGALLAALIQAPSSYDPYINPDFSTQRRNIVIKKMAMQGYINDAQAEEALQTPLILNDGRKTGSGDSFFIDYIIEEAINAVGEEKVFKGGLKIHSTMEPEIQNKAEKVFQQPYLFPGEKVEAAVALVENGTGEIKALVGGRKYVARQGFNRATQLARQPGSAFKPIAVYAPAFEAGYHPDSIISDTPFKLASYEPKNSDNSFYGQITIRTAVQWSRNVAAVRLLDQIGIDKGYEMACKLGFNLTEYDRCLPLALGGLTHGVSPLQMAGAYAAFANEGIYIKPYAIKYIEDGEGEIIYRHPEGTAVMKASTANAVKEVLRTAVTSGTGFQAGIRGTEVAGKTGTTELPDTPLFKGINGNKDAWFVGFTPRYTAAVWMGYDEKDMDRNHYLTSYGGNQPAVIFRAIVAGAMGLSEEPLIKVTAQTKEEDLEDDRGGDKEEDEPDKQAGKTEKENQDQINEEEKDMKDEPDKIDQKEATQENAKTEYESIKEQDTPKSEAEEHVKKEEVPEKPPVQDHN